MRTPILIFLSLFMIFTISLFAQTKNETKNNNGTQTDSIVEEALNDPEFLQFMKRSGQSLDVFEKLKKSDTKNIPLEQTETKKLHSHPLADKNRLLLLGAVENLQNHQIVGFRKRQYEIGDVRNTTPSENFGTRIDLRPGAIFRTLRELDVAIDGNGFFCIADSTRQRFYTRNGSFERSPEGKLALIYGANIYPLEPQIMIPEDWEILDINTQGEVWITPKSSQETPAEKRKVGQLILARFPNADRLRPENAVLFSETPLSGKAIFATPDSARTGKIQQCALEQSNVSPQSLRQEIKLLIEATKILEKID